MTDFDPLCEFLKRNNATLNVSIVKKNVCAIIESKATYVVSAQGSTFSLAVDKAFRSAKALQAQIDADRELE
jgi:hypothetical protein